MTDKQIITKSQMIMRIAELSANVIAKEQECVELKEKIKYMEEYIKTVENTRNEFEKESKFLKGENKRLKQTLAEIKEIAENVQSFVGRINIEDDVFEQMEQILQKISEVENER